MSQLHLVASRCNLNLKKPQAICTSSHVYVRTSEAILLLFLLLQIILLLLLFIVLLLLRLLLLMVLFSYRMFVVRLRHGFSYGVCMVFVLLSRLIVLYGFYYGFCMVFVMFFFGLSFGASCGFRMIPV